jgi:hypothetical protein
MNAAGMPPEHQKYTDSHKTPVTHTASIPRSVIKNHLDKLHRISLKFKIKKDFARNMRVLEYFSQ